MFRKIGDQPLEDLGPEPLVKLSKAMSEEEIAGCAMALAEVTDGPEILFEVRDVPDNAVNTAG